VKKEMSKVIKIGSKWQRGRNKVEVINVLKRGRANFVYSVNHSSGRFYTLSQTNFLKQFKKI